MQNSLPHKALEIKISTVVAVAILIHTPSIAGLKQILEDMTAGTPDFFDNEFAVLDVESVAGENLNWAELITLFKAYGLNPVAVRNAKTEDHAEILSYGLSIDVVNKPRPEPEAEPAQLQQTAAVSMPETVYVASHVPAVVIDTPVRGGQRIYAKGADLIITASVNAGAEVIADGSIHIYSTLRGRALAGATGNTDARIFALGMQAELVSIAGIYRTFENGFPKLHPQQPVQIKLVGDSIEVSSVLSLG